MEESPPLYLKSQIDTKNKITFYGHISNEMGYVQIKKIKKLLLASKSFKIGYRITSLVFMPLEIYVKLILGRISRIIFISLLSKYVDVLLQILAFDEF